MSESALITEILTACSHGPVRLFRTNAGIAWQGERIEQTRERLVLAHPRAIRMGVPGIADLTGWSAGGIYTAIETKTAVGRVSQQQTAFLTAARAGGCRAGVARSLADAWSILTS